jgi:hypothetical protein
MKEVLTVEQLQKGQDLMNQEIIDYAKEKGLSNDNFMPISDGVASIEQYLASSPRIMWILKEPYDKKDEVNNPKGGGWSIPEECFEIDKIDWKIRSWQPIIYSMYGLYNNLSRKEMDSIDNNSMANILRQIAYININKMPALTHSSQSSIGNHYQEWKPILFKQIELYKPEVMIFGGTLDYFWPDLFAKSLNAKAMHQYEIDNHYYLSAYKTENEVLVLQVDHPSAPINKTHYVTSIIEAIKKFS